METEINIVEILKDKPQGTKLYSSACGKCNLKEVDDKSFKISFYNSKFGFMNGGEGYLDKNGKLYDDGECVVFPSKEMRDWRKFAWKKGDVLVNKDGDVHIIFERFVDDTYCSFVGKYYLWKENNDTEQFYEKERLLTSDFQKAGKDAVQTYISTIEERLGGKLNRETFEVEKPQPEFKDGDILYAEKDEEHVPVIFILNSSKEGVFYYASLTLGDYMLCDYKGLGHVGSSKFRFATEEEKKKLFDILAIENKAWDAEKKQIVDLKSNVELKPFDKVLVRNDNIRKWEADLFGFKNVTGHYHCVGGTWLQCISYIGNEHLLGTTNNVEG